MFLAPLFAAIGTEVAVGAVAAEVVGGTVGASLLASNAPVLFTGGFASINLPIALSNPALLSSGGGLFGLTSAQIFNGISIGAKVIGGVSSLVSGNQQSKILKQQAERQRIQGLQEINDINRELIDRAATNNAATRASGLKFSGSALRVDEELTASASRNTSVARGNSRTRAAVSLAQADQAKSAGQAGLIRGLGGAATSIVKLKSKSRSRTSALNFV